MSTFDKIAIRVAMRTLLAGFSMDGLARLSFLEGVAGVNPGTWIRQKSRGFTSADEWASMNDGYLHPNWTTNRNTGFYDAVGKAVASVLRGVSGIDPEDIAQEIISESSLPSGRANRRMFYSAGAAIAKDKGKMRKLLDGDLTPASVKGIPAQSAKRLALNEKKRKREQMESAAPDSRLDSRDDFFSQQPTISVDDPHVRQNVLLMALNSPESFPGSEKIRAVIDTVIDRVYSKNEKKAALMKAFFRELASGKSKYLSPSKDQRAQLKKDPSYFYRAVMRAVSSAAAKSVGIKPGRMTNEVFGAGGKNVEKFVEQYLSNNPAINNIVDVILDDLEFSTEWAHGARLAAMYFGEEEEQTRVAEIMGLEPNEYLNYDLVVQDNVMGEPRTVMAEELLDRRSLTETRKQVYNVIQRLAEMTMDDVRHSRDLIDIMADLERAHKKMAMLARRV